MKRVIIFNFALLLFTVHSLAVAQAPEPQEAPKSVVVEQESNSGQERNLPLSQAAAKNKEKIRLALKKKRAVTIKLKQGAIYHFVPNYSSEVKQAPAVNTKIAGRIEQVGEDQFWIGERGLTGWQYLTLRIRYEDVEDVHFNLISNGVKSTGEFVYYCVLLLPFGICDP